MARKIKLHTFHFLFRMFAYLADKSEGWRVFVLPKFLLGSLIVGLGLTGSGVIEAQNKAVKNSDLKANSKKTIVKDTIKMKENEALFIEYETMPVFPGGDTALLDFVYKNLKYPESAIKDKIQGKVTLRFVITKTGEIDKVEIIRSLQPDCDKEAIRVVKMLPKFAPATDHGKPESIWYTMPVIFKLDNNVPKN